MRRPSFLSSPVVWGLSLAACSSAEDHRSNVAQASASLASPGASAPSPVSSASSTAAPPFDAKAALEKRLVDTDHVGRKVLYSWTTEAQLTELQGGSPLFTRTVSASRGPSAFDDLISTETERGNAFTRLLYAEGFAKKRFAWPSPYATATGEADGSYGNVLLRIELKDEALILDYASGVAYGIDGKVHPFEEVAEHPELLAGALFNGGSFREYVLFNESMVARFSAGGAKDVKASLAADSEFLLSMADAIEEERGRTPGLPSVLAAAMDGTLAFNVKLSLEEMRSRAKLFDTYRAMPRAAVEREPKATFVKGGVRAPLPPVCKVVTRTPRTERRFEGSYVRPGKGSTYTIYVAVCEGANKGVMCTASQGTLPKDAACTPVPVFGQ